jgi:hypothetical protein
MTGGFGGRALLERRFGPHGTTLDGKIHVDHPAADDMVLVCGVT